MNDKRSLIANMISNDNTTEKTKDSLITVPEKEESRSKRVSFLVQPSLYTQVKKKCKQYDISMNECVNQLFKRWIEEE